MPLPAWHHAAVPTMTALRLLVTGLGLLLVALVVVTSGPWFAPTVLSLRGWSALVLTAVGCGLVVSAGLVSALKASERATAPEPAVDHYG